MPNAPKTPIRTMRIDDRLWDAFGELVDDRSAIVRDFVRWYVRDPGAKMPRRPDVTRSDDGDHGTELPHSTP